MFAFFCVRENLNILKNLNILLKYLNILLKNSNIPLKKKIPTEDMSFEWIHTGILKNKPQHSSKKKTISTEDVSFGKIHNFLKSLVFF